jgi:hypothetical protein
VRTGEETSGEMEFFFGAKKSIAIPELINPYGFQNWNFNFAL